jgi:CDP-glycerol glycerophosphotransferase (TagB/SpsB family)
LPRFDRVLEAGAKYPPERRDLILVAPTWRTWLVAKQAPGSQRWAIDAEEFRQSEFAQSWRAVLISDELRDLAKRTGLRVGVLMHPNLQPVASSLDLPPEIETFTFEGSDVRALFARARVVVTDYSSMAFNAAYIDRPIVYFQFDHERMFSGGHVGRGGYFQYERDGFGPVAYTVPEAIEAVVDAVEHGPQPRPEYLKRIEEAFPSRDGRCCERVVAAIRQSSRKVDRRAVGPELIDEATVAIAAQRAVEDEIATSGDAEAPEPGADPELVDEQSPTEV